MVCFTRIFGGLLVGFLGLVLYSSAFAVTLDTNAQALQACISRSDSFTGSFSNTSSTIQSDEVYTSKCVFNPVANDRYSCIYILDVTQTRLSDNNITTFHYAGFCDGNPPAGHNQRPSNRQATGEAAAPWYASYVPSSSSGNTVSCLRDYVFCFGENTCSNKTEFDSTTIRAPTPNGTGMVCHDSCQYEVSFWYQGTYPAGQLVYTFSPSGNACAPTDLQPEPVPNDDLPEDIDSDTPLDLDPDKGGVDKPVDPGPGRDDDGHGSSSGGGSCDSPPACTGEPIQCNILFQTWSTRCAIAGGDGGEGGEGGNGEILGDIRDGVDGLRDDLSGAFSDGGVGDGAGLSEISSLVGNKTFGPDDIDAGGWGFPRSCPLWSDVSFAVGTTNIVLPLSTFTLHCDIFEWTGYLIVAFAAFWASMIIIRGD